MLFPSLHPIVKDFQNDILFLLDISEVLFVLKVIQHEVA